MAAETTTTVPSTPSVSIDTKLSKFQLISLLKDCVEHLEESDEYSPIIYQTSNKLHEYADTQAKVLQTQLLQLKQERDLAIKQTKALQKEQKEQKANVELGKPQASAASAAAANPNMSAFEQQKRAAAQQRRQQVIEQRRKAALEQKRKEEERHRKFLEKEQRKELLKAEAVEKAAQNKVNASLTQETRIEQDAMSELDKISGRSSSFEKQEEQPQVPMSPASPMTSPSPTQRSTPVASPTSHAKIPDISAVRPPPPLQQTQKQPPSSIPPPTAQAPSPSSCAKYSSMSHGTTTAAKETKEESPLFDSTELKREILLQWGLQPPDYQMLKRVEQLVATIQNVYPPFSGVPAHSYFDGWKAVKAADFIRYDGDNGIAELLDFDKVKKAVRRVRVFLHPDKLPRDFTEAQIFVCKLLWDVTNDALEDLKQHGEVHN